MNSSVFQHKIALGTVQIGLQYGINNSGGRPGLKEAIALLDLAVKRGVRLFDTAEAYGDSIKIIATYLNEKPDSPVEIVSKFRDNGIPIEVKLNDTLTALGRSQLYAYLYHSFKDYEAKNFRPELLALRDEKKIERIGVSIYSTEELEIVLKDPEIKVIQLPLNPFDNSRKKRQLLSRGKELGKEIHVRSIYLQGLFFMNPSQLPGNLRELKKPLEQFNHVIAAFGLNTTQACLNFALQDETVDFAIIGMESEDQLTQNLNAVLPSFPARIRGEFESIEIKNRLLLNPSHWKI